MIAMASWELPSETMVTTVPLNSTIDGDSFARTTIELNIRA